MRAVKGSLGHSPWGRSGEIDNTRLEGHPRWSCAPGTRALRMSMSGQTRWSPVLVQRAVSEDPRWTRAVGDHLARPQRVKVEEQCTRRPHVDQHGRPPKRGNASELGGSIYIVRFPQLRQPWPLSKERYRGGSPWLHNDVKTTMMYIHVLNNCVPAGVRSPLDGL